MEGNLVEVKPGEKLPFNIIIEVKPHYTELMALNLGGPTAITLGRVLVRPLAFCCGAGEIGNLYTTPSFRWQGVGSALLLAAERLLRYNSKGFALATDIVSGLTEAMLLKRGWVMVQEFRNPNTQNLVRVYVKVLNNLAELPANVLNSEVVDTGLRIF